VPEPGNPPRTDNRPLSLHWDGTEWNDVIVPSPPTGNEEEVRLNDVTAVASDDVWAVGYYIPPGSVNTIETLAMRWNGSEWDQVPSPAAQIGNGSSFYAIDSKDGEVWAVGSSLGTGGIDHLAARWDGSGWEEYFPERILLGTHRLTSVDIVSPDEVWAAGNIGALGLPYVTRWDGSSWEEVEPRIDESLYLGLTSIIAFAPDDAWVGASRTENFEFQYFVYLHYDGSSWTEYPVVHPFHVPSFEGDDTDDFYSGGYGTLAHFDGTAWSLVDTLAVDVWAIGNIDVLPSGKVWGAGTTYDTGIPETLTATFDPCRESAHVSAADFERTDLLALAASQPNPMKQWTEIRLFLGEASEVQVEVFTLAGKRTRLLHSGRLGSGSHVVTWDGRDDEGTEVSSGVYFVRARAANVDLSRKLVVRR
jgi:hypothetical protein